MLMQDESISKLKHLLFPIALDEIIRITLQEQNLGWQ
jgi:hypothetical protein